MRGSRPRPAHRDDGTHDAKKSPPLPLSSSLWPLLSGWPRPLGGTASRSGRQSRPAPSHTRPRVCHAATCARLCRATSMRSAASAAEHLAMSALCAISAIGGGMAEGCGGGNRCGGGGELDGSVNGGTRDGPRIDGVTSKMTGSLDERLGASGPRPSCCNRSCKRVCIGPRMPSTHSAVVQAATGRRKSSQQAADSASSSVRACFLSCIRGQFT